MKFFEHLSEKYHIVLNDQQRQAVEHHNGPALVLAGPGSGKTTVITARTAYLCLACGVKPGRILSITYSRASARDMDERFNSLYGGEINGKVRFSTIHSFCDSVLHDYERRQGNQFDLLEGHKQRAVLHDIFKRNNMYRASEEEMSDLMQSIGLVKNKMLKDPSLFETDLNAFPAIYEAYEAYKKEHLLIDFDDMLRVAYIVLRKCPDILQKYQNWYPYVQVDEAQDASKIQFAIIRLLVGKKRNLFVVADDDQSIYGFRGAEPSEILSIEQTYPGCRIFKLEKNYRSTRNIVEISSKFIRMNTSRFDKRHFTDNPVTADPVLLQCDNSAAQWNYMLDTMQSITEKMPKSTFAVLFRNNLSAVHLVDLLDHNHIPFNIRETDMFFFTHWVVQDVVAILRFALNQTDADAFMRFYYKIGRYLSKVLAEYATDACGGRESVLDAAAEYPALKPFQARKVLKLKDEFKGIAKVPARNALRYFETEFHYVQYVEDYCKKNRLSAEYAVGMFRILCDIAEGCTSVSAFLERLGYLQKQFKHRKRKDGVNLTLSTFHSSKGLEFDTVFMIDLTNAEIPGNAVVENPVENVRKIEEERRLWYVAMTRARKNLYLLYPNENRGAVQEPSMFMGETAECIGIKLPESRKLRMDTVDMQLHFPLKQVSGAMIPVGEGEVIHHIKFGDGIVLKVTRERGLVLVDAKFGEQVKILDWKMCLSAKIVKCG